LSRYSIIAGYVGYLGGAPRILDVGCGNGLLMERLAPLAHTYVGCDYAFSAVEQASRRAHAGATLVAADAARLPFKAACFDVVICNEVLYYLESSATLPALLRLLRPGGRLIVSMNDTGGTPDPAWRSVKEHTLVEDMVTVTHASSGETWRVALLRPRS